MAEEHIETPEVDEEQEFSAWLESISSTPEQEEETVPEEDTDPLVVAQTAKRKVDEFIVEQKADRMVDEFMARAPDGAKELFSIYRRGDEDPKQLKALMELATVKAREVDAKAAPEVTAKAEAKAEEIAKSRYGVGPIQPSMAPVGPSDDEQWQSARERVLAGDTHTAYKMFASLAPNTPDQFKASNVTES